MTSSRPSSGMCFGAGVAVLKANAASAGRQCPLEPWVQKGMWDVGRWFAERRLLRGHSVSTRLFFCRCGAINERLIVNEPTVSSCRSAFAAMRVQVEEGQWLPTVAC